MKKKKRKRRLYAVWRSGLVNVYVIDDPTNPDNNGKVKMLRYGKQLHKIITEAIEGEDAEEFGPRVFDLGAEGVNFKIKVEQQGDYPTYVSSRFTTAGKIDLSDDQQEKAYTGVFDLSQVFPLKSYDELKQMLDEHYFCKSEDAEELTIPEPPAAVASKEVVSEPAPAAPTATSVDDDIDELLKDL